MYQENPLLPLVSESKKEDRFIRKQSKKVAKLNSKYDRMMKAYNSTINVGYGINGKPTPLEKRLLKNAKIHATTTSRLNNAVKSKVARGLSRMK